MPGEQHIARIGRDAARAVGYLIVIIHASAGEERRIRLTTMRIDKFFSQTFTARQRTAKNTRPTGLTFPALDFIFILFIVFVFVVFYPGIITTGTVAGKGQNIEQPAAKFFGDANPGPAGKERQPCRPHAQKRNGATTAVQQRL